MTDLSACHGNCLHTAVRLVFSTEKKPQIFAISKLVKVRHVPHRFDGGRHWYFVQLLQNYCFVLFQIYDREATQLPRSWHWSSYSCAARFQKKKYNAIITAFTISKLVLELVYVPLEQAIVFLHRFVAVTMNSNSNMGWRERSALRKARNLSTKISIDTNMNDAKDSLAQTTVSFRAIRQMRAQKSPVPSSSFDNDSANRQATKLDQDHNLLAGPSLEIRREGQNLSDMEFDCHMSSLEIRRPDQNISDTGLDSRTSCSFSDAGYASEASTRRVRFSSNVTIKSNVLEVRPLNDEGPTKLASFGSPPGSSPSVAARLARALSRNFQCIMPSPTRALKH